MGPPWGAFCQITLTSCLSPPWRKLCDCRPVCLSFSVNVQDQPISLKLNGVMIGSNNRIDYLLVVNGDPVQDTDSGEITDADNILEAIPQTSGSEFGLIRKSTFESRNFSLRFWSRQRFTLLLNQDQDNNQCSRKRSQRSKKTLKSHVFLDFEKTLKTLKKIKSNYM